MERVFVAAKTAATSKIAELETVTLPLTIIF